MYQLYIELIVLDFKKFDFWTCVLKKFKSCWFLKSWGPLMYRSNRSLNIPPGHLNFWKIFVQIPSSRGRKAVQMPHHRSIPGDQMSPPRETFQWLLLCSESCVCKHGLIENNLTCHEARGGQVTGNHPPKRINNKVDKFWCQIWYYQ